MVCFLCGAHPLIELSIRYDLELSLLRFFGAVSVPDIKEAVTAAMIRNATPPYSTTALVDARMIQSYDASFLELIGFSQWLRSVFAPSGRKLPILILVDNDWKYGMAHMFAMAAGAVGGLGVCLCATEAAMLDTCGIDDTDLEGLFQPEHLFYRSPSDSGSIAV